MFEPFFAVKSSKGGNQTFKEVVHLYKDFNLAHSTDMLKFAHNSCLKSLILAVLSILLWHSMLWALLSNENYEKYRNSEIKHKFIIQKHISNESVIISFSPKSLTSANILLFLFSELYFVNKIQMEIKSHQKSTKSI